MSRNVIRSIRKGSVQWNEEDRLNLAKETIERMNIPDVLKRFSEMELEDKAE